MKENQQQKGFIKNNMDYSLAPIYETKTRDELIEIITLKNEELLKKDYEIERLENLNKLIKKTMLIKVWFNL